MVNKKAKTKTKVKKIVKKSAKKVTKKPVKKMAAAKAPVKTKAVIDLKKLLIPLDDRILVSVSKAERKTPGGLFIPDTVGDTSGNLEGFVVAAGRGHCNRKGRVRPMDVKIGDCVIFPQYAGDKVEMQGENIFILREGDVMGILNR